MAAHQRIFAQSTSLVCFCQCPKHFTTTWEEANKLEQINLLWSAAHFEASTSFSLNLLVKQFGALAPRPPSQARSKTLDGPAMATGPEQRKYQHASPEQTIIPPSLQSWHLHRLQRPHTHQGWVSRCTFANKLSKRGWSMRPIIDIISLAVRKSDPKRRFLCFRREHGKPTYIYIIFWHLCPSSFFALCLVFLACILGTWHAACKPIYRGRLLSPRITPKWLRGRGAADGFLDIASTTPNK